VLDTRDWSVEPDAPSLDTGERYELAGRSLAVLRLGRNPRSPEGA
jgi:hypothetical protein